MAAATLAGRALLLTDGARRGLNSQAFRWAIAPSLAAWFGLIAFAASGVEPVFCLAPAKDTVHGFLRAAGVSLAGIDPAAVTFSWGLMLVAMMAPLLVPMITYVAARSFVDRRDRAVGLFVTGYATVWIAAAAVAFVGLLPLRTLGHYDGAGFLGAAAASLWQLSRSKQRALNRCHGVRPLRADGFAADKDAFNFGLLHGSRCVRACTPTMFLTMIGGHALITTAVVFTVLMAERTASKPRQSGAAALLLLTGLLSTSLA